MPAEPDDDASQRDTIRLLAWTLLTLALAVAGIVRIVMERRILPHLDESATLLAIEQTAATGYPLLPSNVFYSQGLTFTFLATPATWLFDDPQDVLQAARWINIALGLATLLVIHFITRDATGSWIAGIAAVIAVGLDPNMVKWSIWIRPYGALTLVTMLIVLVAIRVVRDGPNARVMRTPAPVWIVVLGWLSVFTQVLVAILLPAILVVALILVRKRGLRRLRPVIVAVGLAALAPVALLLLNSQVGVGSGSGGPSTAVIGSHLLGDTVQNPFNTHQVWTGLFSGSRLDAIVPFVFLLAAGICVLGALRTDVPRQRELIVLLSFTLLPILLMLFIYPSTGQPRYVAHVFPLGYVVLAASAVLIWPRTRHVFTAFPRYGLAALIVGVPILYLVQASDYRFAVEPGGSTTYEESIEWLSENVGDGDRVIMALPQLLVFADDDGRLVERSMYLAGPEDRDRTSRYVKTQSDGAVTDFWLGIPTIASTGALCGALELDGGAVWLVVDRFRLNDDSFFGGEMADLIRGSSEEAFTEPNFGRVWEVRPRSGWSAEAIALCPAAPTRSPG